MARVLVRGIVALASAARVMRGAGLGGMSAGWVGRKMLVWIYWVMDGLWFLGYGFVMV